MVRSLAVALVLTGLAVPAAAARPKAPATMFVQFDCDALEIDQPLDSATLHDLEPAHSLDEAAAVLTRHNVKFVRGPRVWTIPEAPPKLVREITTMKQGEPIILPDGDGSAICVLRPSADSI